MQKSNFYFFKGKTNDQENFSHIYSVVGRLDDDDKVIKTKAKNKRIIQTFWTKPMPKDKIKTNVLIAALSLAYANRCGYQIVMYTDSIGYEYLKYFPYYEINKKLDKMPLVKCPEKMFSMCKYFAFNDSILNNVHIDYDIFLKKPCLDSFLDGDGDVYLQCNEWPDDFGYWDVQKWMKGKKHPKDVDLDTKVVNSYNVGVIGFNKPSAKNRFIKNYMEAVSIYKNEELPLCLDFFLEQGYIKQMCDKYNFNVKFLIDFSDNVYLEREKLVDFTNKIGYCHLQSTPKYTKYWTDKMLSKLKNNFPEFYDILEKKVGF